MECSWFTLQCPVGNGDPTMWSHTGETNSARKFYCVGQHFDDTKWLHLPPDCYYYSFFPQTSCPLPCTLLHSTTVQPELWISGRLLTFSVSNSRALRRLPFIWLHLSLPASLPLYVCLPFSQSQCLPSFTFFAFQSLRWLLNTYILSR